MSRISEQLLPLLLTGVVLGGLLLAGCDSGGPLVPSDVGSNTTVSFTLADTTVSEAGGSVTFGVEPGDAGFKQFTVDIVRTENQLGPDDARLPEPTTVTFDSSTTSGETVTYTIEIEDDSLFNEGNETVTYALQNPSNAALGETSTFTLTVEENDTAPDAQTIATARDQSLGTPVTVRGVVTGKDGSNIIIQDESGTTGASGIVVRDDRLEAEYLDGVIQPGDLIQASGELGAFSGILQVSGDDLSFIQLERDTQALPDPQAVTVSDLLGGGGEDYESERITITGLTIDDGGDDTFQEDANYSATDNSTTQSVTLRIIDAEDSFYVGEPIPTEAVTFTGVLYQFNFGFGGARDPDTGYQLYPLFEGDLE